MGSYFFSGSVVPKLIIELLIGEAGSNALSIWRPPFGLASEAALHGAFLPLSCVSPINERSRGQNDNQDGSFRSYLPIRGNSHKV